MVSRGDRQSKAELSGAFLSPCPRQKSPTIPDPTHPHRRLKIATKKMSSSEPAQKKAKLEESSSSSTSSAETYPVIDRVANGAHVRGMAAYQAM